jgi:hypothetical protein
VRCVVHTERLHVIVFARGTLSFYHKTHSGNRQKRARVVFATWQLPCCARSLFSAPPIEARGEQTDPFSHSCDQHLHIFLFWRANTQTLAAIARNAFSSHQTMAEIALAGRVQNGYSCYHFHSFSVSPCSVPGSSASIRFQHFAVRFGENKKICKKIVV